MLRTVRGTKMDSINMVNCLSDRLCGHAWEPSTPLRVDIVYTRGTVHQDMTSLSSNDRVFLGDEET